MPAPLPPLTHETAAAEAARRLAMERYLERGAPQYPGACAFAGAGVVTLAGGPYTLGALVMLKSLRHHGSDLPCTVYHFPAELTAWHVEEFAKLGASCVDLGTIPEWQAVRAVPAPAHYDGWRAKALAVRVSPYQDVAYIDADAYYAVRTPEHFFHSAAYKTTGAVFFPDLPWEDLTADHLRRLGVSYTGAGEEGGCTAFEAGQFFVDKARCWRELCLAEWMATHADFYFRYLYGDKDTFNVAWRKTGRPRGLVPVRPEFRLHTLVHFDFEGREAIYHRARNKPSFDFGPGKFGPFKHTGQYFRGLKYHEDLALEREVHAWARDFKRRAMPPGDLALVDCITERVHFILVHCGRGRRLVAFVADGEFGEGLDGWAWHVNQGRLFIASGRGTEAVLVPQPDGAWAGQMVQDGKEPVLAVPLSLTVEDIDVGKLLSAARLPAVESGA